MRLLFVALAALLSSCAPAYGNVVSDALNQSVTLWGGKPARAVCSGVIIRSSAEIAVIATAKHCVTEGHVYLAHFYDGEVGVVQSARISAQADVATVNVASRRHPVISMFDNVLEGQPLFLVGAPTGEAWSFSSAYSRSGNRLDPEGDGPSIEVECSSCYFGDSGAGVFDYRGRVVGIMVAGGAAAYPSVVDVVPMHFVRALL